MTLIQENFDVGDLLSGDGVFFGNLETRFRIDFVDESIDKIDDQITYDVYIKEYRDSTLHFKDGKSADSGICDIIAADIKDRTKTNDKCFWCNGTGKR